MEWIDSRKEAVALSLQDLRIATNYKMLSLSLSQSLLLSLLHLKVEIELTWCSFLSLTKYSC